MRTTKKIKNAYPCQKRKDTLQFLTNYLKLHGIYIQTLKLFEMYIFELYKIINYLFI